MRISMIGHKRIPSREGGVEVVVEELSTRLVKDGYDVDVYNRKGKNVQDKEADKEKRKLKKYKGIKLITIPTINKKGIDALIYSIFATIKAIFGKYDIIHYHAEGSCAMLWLPHLFGIKTVATIHGLDWQRSKWGGLGTAYIKLGERIAAKYADEIIVLSTGVQNYFREKYNRETQFIPNGVNKPQIKEAKIIKEKWGLEKDSYILFLARIVPEKGLDYLINAYRQINTDKKLVIAGGASHTNGYLEQIKENVKDDKNIIMTGFVQGEEFEELYSNCFLYCLPSDIEGMPLTLLEAMSYGRNCLVSDIEENLQVVGEYAHKFKKGNVEDLKEKLEEILKSDYKNDSEKTSNYVIEKFNWDDTCNKTEKIYEKVIEKKNKFCEKFYLIFISLMTIYWSLEIIGAYTNFGKLKYICVLLGGISIIISLLNNKFTKKEKKYFLAGIIATIMCYVTTGLQHEGILTIVPTIFGVKSININKVLKTMFNTLFTVFMIFILFNIIGIIPFEITYKIDRFGQEYRMYSFGKIHGNNLYLYIYTLIALYMYINKETMNWKKYIICIIISIISYILFQSRTAFVLSILLICGFIIINKLQTKNINVFLSIILKNFHFIMFIIVIALSTFMSNTAITELLDKIITSRLSCAQYYFENYGISLFPRKIIESLVFDNMYAGITIHYGIIFVIIYCLIYQSTIKKLLENKKYIEVFLIIVYALYAYSEKGFLKVFSNFPMLFIAYLLYDNLFESNNIGKNKYFNAIKKYFTLKKKDKN